MPSSVNFGNRCVNIRDSDLVVLLNVLLECVPRVDDNDWFRRVREKWQARILGCGFGLYDLDLDELVTHPEEKQRMLHIFSDAKIAIQAHGEYVKKEWLNSLPHREGVYFKDQETSRFRGILESIEGLVGGEESGDRPSSFTNSRG